MRGEKVILARLREEDLESILEPFSNLELTTYLMGWGFSSSEAEQRKWLTENLKNTPSHSHFGIYRENKLIGGINLRDINHRQGYGTEAVTLMCQYGAFHLGLHNILLKVFAFNERAVRAYLKAGFREIGRRTGSVRLGQERFDEVYMELLTVGIDVSGLRAQLRQLQP